MKVKRKVNIRVVVEPDISGFWLVPRGDAERMEKATLQEANRLHTEIRRHVDDSHLASVQWDIEDQCSFCGDTSDWGDDPIECCQEAFDESTGQAKGEEA